MSWLDLCLILCRFGQFAALMLLAGGAVLLPVLVPAGAAPPGWPRARALLAVATAATAVLWLMLLAAAFTGGAGAMLSPQALLLVLGATAFGHVWSVRLILSAVLLAALATSWTRRHLVPATSMLLLASLGATGHAADGGPWSELAQMAHLLAGGLWLGGLGVLLALARERATAPLAAALRRFSPIGIVLVAVIAVTGLANSWLVLRGPGDLVTTDYGQTLAVKLVLVACMLALAANNRLRLMPELPARPAPTRHALLWSIGAEAALGLGVLAVTAFLGMMSPPGD